MTLTSVAAGREALFRPFGVRSLHLSNRLAMSPMTRMGCPGALPDEVNRDYYADRAARGTGLVVTEGVGVGRLHPVGPEITRVLREAAPLPEA